jgi:serine/threonine-protein kinase
MIRLHTLGVLDLRDADGREVRSVLQQPKRLGLLAYLAIASPRRFHRRDSLLGLFWPELDQEHARAALRRALYFLRAELGAEVVTGRGDDEVEVPEAALWCDTTALEQALASGDAETALSHYRGTLLDGLYVAGAAPELQEWLDRERLRLRERAGAAARTLAASAEREGRLGAAASWARRALELAPDDETALRHYLGLLDRTGERSAALRAYEEFAHRLAQELELEPSVETLALVETLRARVENALPRAASVPAAADPSAASPTTIAVLPFSVRGDARLAYLGAGMVDLLSTKLDGAGELRTVDPRALLNALGSDGAATADAPAVARRFGAGRYLVGSIVEAGGRLEASASLHGLDGAVAARVHAAAAGEGELFELVDELARQLLAVNGVAPGTRLTRIAALTTGSLHALRAYLLGERELRAGRYFDAMEGFQAAVDADPSFALAYYRLAAAAAGCALPDVAREVADRGAEHQERLSPHDRLVFAAQRAWLHGAVDQAESLYNTITGTYPDDVAELQQARAITVAIAFADVALYSANLPGAEQLARSFLQVARSAELRALCHILLAHLALAAGNLDGMRTELRAAESLDRTWGIEMRALFASLPFVPVDEAELRAVRDDLERWNPADAAPSMFVIFAMHNDLHPAIRTYLLGLLEVRLGELASAAARLETLAELEAGGPLVRNLTVELDAAIARARGRPKEALARLERARPELWFQLTVASPFFSLASQRFLRARLLEETGRTAEAAGWYRSMAERSPYELIYRGER